MQDMGLEVYTIDRLHAVATRSDPDLAISLGGDGTVLFAARTASPASIPILPVNVGKIGFIAAVAPEKWFDVFEQWQAGTASFSYRLMLEVMIRRDEKIVFRGTCLNDAVISSSINIINIKLSIDGIELASYRSNGLILATPTGSTAYSLSAGGPILDPEIDAVIINPICPFGLKNRPMVISACSTLSTEIDHQKRSKIFVTLDGQNAKQLEPYDRVFIKKAPYKAQLIACDKAAFYHAVNTKL